MTDHCVGDGSTVTAVTEAYAGDATVERTLGGQASKIVQVTPNDPDAGQYIAFTLADDDSVGQPHVGRSQGSEGCGLAEATRTSAATPRSSTAPISSTGSEASGLYTTDQGNLELVVRPAGSCTDARELFDRDYAGEGVPVARNAVVIDAYTCVGNPAGIAGETGVLSYCYYHGSRFELRYR